VGIPVLLDRGTPQSQGRDRGHAFLFEVLLLVKVRAIKICEKTRIFIYQ
jgi:hypothetical protein